MFNHPKNVCMTYTEHMNFSLYLSFILWIGSIQAFIHAFFPDTCVTSTSDLNVHIYKTIKNAGCK